MIHRRTRYPATYQEPDLAESKPVLKDIAIVCRTCVDAVMNALEASTHNPQIQQFRPYRTFFFLVFVLRLVSFMR